MDEYTLMHEIRDYEASIRFITKTLGNVTWLLDELKDHKLDIPASTNERYKRALERDFKRLQLSFYMEDLQMAPPYYMELYTHLKSRYLSEVLESDSSIFESTNH